jgi:prephenate dehydrogenase
VAIDRVGVIGTGLIGGSIGLAVLKRDLVKEVVAYDLKQDRLDEALRRRAITVAVASPKDVAATADLVVLASPVKSIPSLFAEINNSLKGGAIVTDVGSAKSRIVEEIEPMVREGISFIAGHPLAGSEDEGIEAADAHMFEGAVWLLTPGGEPERGKYEELCSFIEGLGARPMAMDPARHDELVGLMSHLPQVVASALAGFVADHVDHDLAPKLAAGGFRDTTRVAASSPELWAEILNENRDQVLDLLCGFKDRIVELHGAIEKEDWPALKELLARAQIFRSSIPKKPGVTPSELVEFAIQIPDRPGVLGEITEVVGDAGVNIEDLQISHSPAGRGTLHLFIKGDAHAQVARDAISGRGFEVHQVRQ